MPDHHDAVAGCDLRRVREALSRIFGDRLAETSVVREQHAQDEGHHRLTLPDFVAFPRDADEVAGAVAVCAAHGVPVTPWGAGTSLEGAALPSRGGLCIDLSGMDRIVSIDPDDLTVTVQPGVRRLQLNAALKDTGLHFPVDPGADATLGGMAATRASGTTSLRYGTMKGNVLACEVVLADGRTIRTARRAPKTSAGYDLTALMLGSEGTLGVITELTLRLHPLPEAALAIVCTFDGVGAAVRTVIEAVQCGLGAARLELMDAAMMAAVNAFAHTHHAVAPTLFVELHGPQAALDLQAETFQAIADGHGGLIQGIATLAEARSALWKARHNALYAARAQRPGGRLLITDVCVPISRLAECIDETRGDLDRSALPAFIAGHVGDGNFHSFILFDPSDPAEAAEAHALHERMGRRAIGMGGTCTGEHGVGVGKRELLEAELGPAVAVMADIKRALDPHGILNPGKILRP